MVKYNFKGVYTTTPKKIEEESIDVYLALHSDPEDGIVIHFVDKNGKHILGGNLLFVKFNGHGLLYFERAYTVDNLLPMLTIDEHCRVYVK